VRPARTDPVHVVSGQGVNAWLAEEVLGADLVVDATGRGSRTPAWLDALGYARPEREQVRIGLGYATGTYRLAGDALGGDLAVLHGITPQHPRGGALQVLQDGRWMLTLAGILGDHPPTDPDGFLAFARSLRFPDIYEAIRDAEPLDDPAPSASQPASGTAMSGWTASQT
jgi:hypothetical protein